MMTVTKKALPRRTVLRGIGTTLALPLLDAMIPAFSVLAKSAANPVRRFQAVYVPNGMAMPYWTPKDEGTAFEFTPILSPLKPFREHMLVLSGLQASWAGHAGGPTTFLSGALEGGRRTETEIRASTTIDQLIAQQLGKTTQLPSLELSLDSKGLAGQCASFIGCTYVSTISWKSTNLPLPMESNPRAVFQRLFGDTGSTDTATQRARREDLASLLDSVGAKVAELKRTLGAPDRIRVDEYLEAVRDLETRIQKAEAQSALDLPVIEQPAGAPETLEDYAKLMFDLQILALQSDMTRVITFMVGREQSSRTYNEIGVPDAHHPLSHHGDDPERVARMSKINAFHARLFANYLDKLKTTSDGDGSLLDHMTILYGSGISNSSIHSPKDLPLVVAGGADGRIKGGRHLRYKNDLTMANLLVTLMDKVGIPIDHLGNSSGALPIDTLSGV